MGVMRFLIYPPELIRQWREVHRAYIGGMDGRVFPTRIEVDGNVLVCRREVSESGKLHVAWPVPGFGRPVINTASLPEREEPYLLPVELARGKIAQLRDQMGAWEVAGMSTPGELTPLYQSAHELFAQATVLQHVQEQSSEFAVRALAKACEAAELLVRSYIHQRLSVRRKRTARVPVSLGCNLGRSFPIGERPRMNARASSPAGGPQFAGDSAQSASQVTGGDDRFCDAFDAAEIPIEWKSVEPVEGEYNWETYDSQVQWCQERRLLTYGGPLLDLSPEGLPGWLWQWNRDFFNLLSFVCDFVETAISRYIGKIRHWEVSARANTGGALALSEENRLALVARTLEVARQVDEEIRLALRIDQPWGTYQARGQHRLSPLGFVDALLRSGARLSEVNLEIGVGYQPNGCASRDVLDFSRLVDRWSCLGVPLQVTLAVPSGDSFDPQAKPDIEVDSGYWKKPWNERTQSEWVELYAPLLMAKESVIGVHWTHFSDAVPHLFPHAGVVRPDGTPKPILERFVKFRQEYFSAGGQSK